MKKRLVILLSNILSIILIAISLSGCKWFRRRDPEESNPEKIAYKEGELYYYVNNESAIILGLANKEKEREELVIPETLGGYPVKQIGEGFSTLGSSVDYGIDATNINRIIINHECRIRDETSITNLKELIINADVKIYEPAYFLKIETIIFNIDLSSLTRFNDWEAFWGYGSIENRLITFDAVGGELKTNAIALKLGKKLLEPEQPTKEDHIFGGWYKDERYVNEWNFDEDIVEEDITLYAKWIEV